MVQVARTLPPASSAFAPAGALEAHEAPLAADVNALLDAILATGAPAGEAYGLAAKAHGVQAVLPQLMMALGLESAVFNPPAMLHRVGVACPELAMAALGEWLIGHRGIKANVELGMATWVTALPDGVRVAGWLDLRGSGLVSLPAGLKVEVLDLHGCERWDGRIPADAKVSGKVYTDGHFKGILLRDWHRLHPNGERG
jgi:hypothetical protein